MSVKKVWITPDAEKVVMYCARVSSSNQESSNTKLLDYCIKHGHWSVFEMASFCVEIKTSRAISAQILRHRSFSFQEFSQRYAEVVESPIIYEARSQDAKNRQNSVDDMSEEDRKWFEEAQESVSDLSLALYQESLDRGVAKEQARFLLPLSAPTRLYMTGSLRSWLHYLKVRLGNGTQKEHVDIAEGVLKLLKQECPIIVEAFLKS
jgi:thymidylate synthase (FAD)